MTNKGEGSRRGVMKSAAVLVIMVLAGIYLLNPGMGIFAEIPDTIPLVGNLDEVTVTAILLACLAYFGIDLRRFFLGGKIRQAQGRVRGSESPAHVHLFSTWAKIRKLLSL